MKQTAEHTCHGGTLKYFEHEAQSTQCKMVFSIFIPPQAKEQSCAALIYLAGLTCTPDNFTTKANAYKLAAELGLIIIAPDTSPRGQDVPDIDEYNIAKGAGFYINASQEPWQKNFRMEEYVTHELPNLLKDNFPINFDKIGVFGHSMGGHGALTLYLKYPALFKSCSAFSPICAPTQCPWGEKAFSTYFGNDREEWKQHDATELMRNSSLEYRSEIFIDQGLSDQFLEEQLHPHLFAEACADMNHPLILRQHEGYDHSYFFIQSFIEDHLRHHAKILT